MTSPSHLNSAPLGAASYLLFVENAVHRATQSGRLIPVGIEFGMAHGSLVFAAYAFFSTVWPELKQGLKEWRCDVPSF